MSYEASELLATALTLVFLGGIAAVFVFFGPHVAFGVFCAIGIGSFVLSRPSRTDVADVVTIALIFGAVTGALVWLLGPALGILSTGLLTWAVAQYAA